MTRRTFGTTLVRTLSEPLGISWLGVGLQPLTGLGEIGWIPKPRYAVMSAHLEKTGAPAPLNSVQLFERSALTSKLSFRNRSSV